MVINKSIRVREGRCVGHMTCKQFNSDNFITRLITRIMNVSGKSLIGGRQALENRRFIKHLTSEKDTAELKSDLKKAISRILGDKKRLVDNNKGKRLVIRHQTHETKYSLYESILRAKVTE